MAKRQKILLGRIIKIHGYQGGVILRADKSFKGPIPEKGWVFIEYEGKPVPFLIRESEEAGPGMLKLWFDGYETAEMINTVTGCNLFVLTEDSGTGISEGSGNIHGFRLFDAKRNYIGTIEEVMENPGQIVLRVISDDQREILVPLHEDLIVEADQTNKTLIMDLPEGLTDLNR
jgi:16S rRNA processing protein RimM